MSVQRRQAKSGVRWDVRLRDPGGRVFTRTFRTRADADRFEREQLRKRDRGEWIDPAASLTLFDVWADKWLDSNPGKRPKTRASDESTIRLHISPTVGSRAIGSITVADVQGLVNKWVADDYAPSSVRRFYAVLRAILSAAVESDIIGRSPCRNIKLPESVCTNRTIVDGQMVAAIAAQIDPRYETLVWLLAETGLRIGEAAGLRVGRLDLLRRRLTVAESVSEVAGIIHFVGAKSQASRRTLRLSRSLTERLSTHLACRSLTAADAEALAFPAPGGGPLRYGLFRSRVWIPAVTAAGHPDVRPHDLRRSSTTAMVLAGVDPRTAQHRLGHSDVRTTLGVYAQLSEVADTDAAEAVAAQLDLGVQSTAKTGAMVY